MDYRVHRVVSQSPNAMVVLGEDDQRRPLAIKVGYPGAYRRELLAREEAILGLLVHPNIVRRIGPVTHADGPALALEWAGTDLKAVIEAVPGRLGTDVALGIALQIYAALDALHAVGIWHRYLKPDHVLVSPAGVVKLISFGHARCGVPMPVDTRRSDPEAPEDHTLAYTVRYIAPEQIRGGGVVDAAADVWAGAIIASELIAGAHPIGELTDPMEIMQTILGGVAASHPLLRHALDPDPARRPTAAQLRAELAKVAAGPDAIARRLAELGVSFPVMGDENRSKLSGEALEQYDQVMKMPPSTMRDELVKKLLRIAAGAYDYYEWNGAAVRVACSGGASQTFKNGAWQDGGPSYTVRQEECDALTEEELAARHPAAARS